MSRTAAGNECQIVTKRMGAVREVGVTGRLDWASASSFRDRIRAEWVEEMLLVDLGHGCGVDSAGTGEVLAAVGWAGERGQQVVIVATDPILVELLSSLAPTVAIVSSKAEAWRLFCAPPRRWALH